MPNYGPNQILDLNTSFERSLSKLSENHKNFEIGSSKLKLWLLKDAQLPPCLIKQWLRNSCVCCVCVWVGTVIVLVLSEELLQFFLLLYCPRDRHLSQFPETIGERVIMIQYKTYKYAAEHCVKHTHTCSVTYFSLSMVPYPTVSS